MCGFAAMVGLNGARVDREITSRMAECIRHRGPDDQGLYASDQIVLAFRRLSILDLSEAAHQPMVSPDGNVVIVFNGEIFNYVELRAELEAKGHTFRSSGDTEVLLAAYREWGRECLSRLNGMWAFLIYDRRRGVVVGSRDRFGIKPLYWHRSGDIVLFGSEIKAIRASGLYQGGANWSIVSDYLVKGNLDAGDEGVETFYEGIFQVPPGTWFELEFDGTWKSGRFWDLADHVEEDLADPAAEFASLFEDAVRLRMRSDVPVGVCLSGGLDSTAIICASARLRERSGNGVSEALEAFCYHSADHDERSYIEHTRAQTGANINRMDLVDAMPWTTVQEILWFYDQPVHSAMPLVGYQLMGLARSKGVKVLLNGQGADEILAGYPPYFRQRWYTLLGRGRLFPALREIKAYAEAHGLHTRPLLQTTMVRLAKDQLRRFQPYRWLAHKRHLRAARQHPWFSRQLVDMLPRKTPPADRFTLRSGLENSVERAPLPLYLRVEDRNSMAHSVEARVPFLDHRLVSLCFRMKDEWKIRGPWNKYALREAMRGRIPEVVRTRVDKMGFPTQHHQWFAGPWFEPMQDLLASPAARERGIWNVAALRDGLERHRRGEISISDPLLITVAQVELWLDALARDPLDSVPAHVRGA